MKILKISEFQERHLLKKKKKIKNSQKNPPLRSCASIFCQSSCSAFSSNQGRGIHYLKGRVGSPFYCFFLHTSRYPPDFLIEFQTLSAPTHTSTDLWGRPDQKLAVQQCQCAPPHFGTRQSLWLPSKNVQNDEKKNTFLDCDIQVHQAWLTQLFLLIWIIKIFFFLEYFIDQWTKILLVS